MHVKHQRPGYILVAGLLFFSSCKRDSVKPDTLTATTEAQVTPRSSLTNPFSGTPNTFPVRMAIASTFAGPPGASTFREPAAVATDVFGNVYVADQDNHMIKKFDVGGNLAAVFGNGVASYHDGPPSSASFNTPSGIAVGPDGRVFVADQNNNRIRVISADGTQVSTFAGSGRAFFNDGQGTLASFFQPAGIAVDAAGTVYVAEYGNNMIRRITPTGGVTRWAGQTTAGSADGMGSAASFFHPTAITITPDGRAYVADFNNNKIRKIYSGTVTTFAGTGIAGPDDGPGATAKLNLPSSIVSDATGNLYVTEKGGKSAIRFITPDGFVKTVAGGETTGYNNSYDINAQFNNPEGIAIDYAGNIYVADRLNEAVRKVVFVNAVRTLAGNGKLGYQEGGGFGAIIEAPQGIATGPDGSVYIMDAGSRIRKITPAGVTSLVAGTGKPGFKDGPAAQAQFSSFASMVVGRDGTIYVADQLNNRIRKIANGVVSTFAGDGSNGARSGIGTGAAIGHPAVIAFDGDNLAVSSDVGLIYNVTPTGAVIIVNAIIMAPPFNDSSFRAINGIAVDAAGNTYVSTKAHTIYGFARNQPSHIVIGGYDINRNFTLPDFNPTGITFDAFTGRLFIANGFRLSSMAASLTPTQTTATIAGTGVPGDIDAPVLSAQFIDGFGGIGGIAISPSGIIYFQDGSNNKVKALSRL